MKRFALTLVITLSLITPAESEDLYKTVLLRAAPGKLLELIELYKSTMEYYDKSGNQRPFWMRHSQGDQWDLLLLFPMKSYAGYYSPDQIERRVKASKEFSQEEFKRNSKSMSRGMKNCSFTGHPWMK